MNGGTIVAQTLKAMGVKSIFTLSGGHIAAIQVGCKQQGIEVIDVRHEVSSVFAADATARLTGIPGVAVVTAGPGITNTITAVQNARLAQSPLLVLGGASPVAMKGRGPLQDIDQMALMRPNVKWSVSVTRAEDIEAILEKAFAIASEGVPGPVFVELPIDTLLPAEIVKVLYGENYQDGRDLAGEFMGHYGDSVTQREQGLCLQPDFYEAKSGDAADSLRTADRPVMLVGSQAMLDAGQAKQLAQAIKQIGIPVFLSGMARGLLGPNSELQYRHNRTKALKEADVIILVGVPCDFRLGYGAHINERARLISVNRDAIDLALNCQPDLAVHGDPALFVRCLAEKFQADASQLQPWVDALAARENQREQGIRDKSIAVGNKINPVDLCQQIDTVMDDDSIIVVDGGDFVGTAANILKPRNPLSWLDPGVFGTLGVGGGFAVGAASCRPGAELWLLYGDGSSAYSLAEIDTLARHGLSVIAVVGNDAAWGQVVREQVEVFGDDVACMLQHNDYHKVAEGYGGKGLLLDDTANMQSVLNEAKAVARQGKPVLINAILEKSDFRKGSISV